MRRPSNHAAPVTLEATIVAFQQQTDENVRREAYLLLTGQTAGEERAEPLDDMTLVTRRALAKLLKCAPATVDYHRRAGRLEPVYLPNSSRLRGFTASSVRKLLRGGFARTEAAR